MRTLAAAILLSGLFPVFLTQNQGSLGGDVLVFERPGDRWYEGALTREKASRRTEVQRYFSRDWRAPSFTHWQRVGPNLRH
jgi:hypothetical protein